MLDENAIGEIAEFKKHFDQLNRNLLVLQKREREFQLRGQTVSEFNTFFFKASERLASTRRQISLPEYRFSELEFNLRKMKEKFDTLHTQQQGLLSHEDPVLLYDEWKKKTNQLAKKILTISKQTNPSHENVLYNYDLNFHHLRSFDLQKFIESQIVASSN